MQDEALYKKGEADALTNSEQTESWRLETDRMKAELILKHLDGAQSFLDIGCAWGQVLRQLVGKIPRLAGVDESEDRLKGLRDNDLGIETYLSNSSKMNVEDNSFDLVLTSHILHEVILFGDNDALFSTFMDISRVLTPRGRHIIIDHYDPGEGEVKISVDERYMEKFKHFASKFEYSKVEYDISGDEISLSKRDCHNFVTKIWSLNTGAEPLEMRESHAILDRNTFSEAMEHVNMTEAVWEPFNSIDILMNFYGGIKLTKGDAWNRQLFLMSQK